MKVQQDSKSTFAPQIIPKRPKDIPDTIEELYGFEVSYSFVSDVTDKILPQF